MIELVRKRRSIRKYTGEPIDYRSLDILVEALLQAPSSRNNKPWEFVVVDDPHILTKLSMAKEHGSAFLQHAQLGIVICGDRTKSDVWVEDCAIAATIVQLVAESLGLGSCWIQIRKRPHAENMSAEAYIRELLGLPKRLEVASIISIGHPDESKAPIPLAGLEYHRVKRNRYADPFKGNLIT